MDRTISASVDASPEATMAALADLATYPEWLGLVTAAEPDGSTPADGDPAWLVTLRARLGPLARSKRLRMVRRELTDRQVRFERDELDDRQHAPWVLRARVEPTSASSCDAEVKLHYGGSLWSTPLELALASFERTAPDQLSDYLRD